MPVDVDLEMLRPQLKQYNQEHLLQYITTLNHDEKLQLFNDLKRLDLKELQRSFLKCEASLKCVNTTLDHAMKPPPESSIGGTKRCTLEELDKYETEGLRHIVEGHVAVLLLAGGQGTRLGVQYPKGMYDVGLPSKKTLYQLQAERILKIRRYAATKFNKPDNDQWIKWYIMTSEHTKGQTLDFFKRNQYFGLHPSSVYIFEQHMLPCVDFQGQIILETPYKIARAPDGNGGLYKALQREALVHDMETRGVKFVHVYCVDNILVKMADPAFIGFCIEQKAPCGAKVVEKSGPNEAVGVVCQVGGQYQVVEYSEITDQTAKQINTATGRLMYNAGNIANHFFTTEFLRLAVEIREHELDYHVAKKKIPYVQQDGTTCAPKTPNGIKMEKFVFDVFKFAEKLAVWEVDRQAEFAPLKNADGAEHDTPTTCRDALFKLHLDMILEHGGSVEGYKSGGPVPECEISPLASYKGEGLDKLVKGKMLNPPILVQTEEEDLRERDSVNSDYHHGTNNTK